MLFEDVALPLVLKNEGVEFSQKGFILDTGYVNDPQDSGGETNYGITQKSYDPSLVKKIKNISFGEVISIYKENYWKVAKCDVIAQINPALAINVFDCAVNCGTTIAVVKLQDSLNVPNDGHIGPVTLEALKVANPRLLIGEYTRKRQWYYCHLVVLYSKNQKFLNGWILRSLKVYDKCIEVLNNPVLV